MSNIHRTAENASAKMIFFRFFCKSPGKNRLYSWKTDVFELRAEPGIGEVSPGKTGYIHGKTDVFETPRRAGDR